MTELGEPNRRELESIIDSMHDGLVVCDPQGNLLLFNPAALKLFGFRDASELPARQDEFDELLDIWDPEGNPIPAELRPIARALAGNFVTDFELEGLRRETGHRFNARYDVVPVRGQTGNVERIVVTLRDISKLKKAQQVLRESEEQFHKLADSIPQIAWMSDSSGSLLWCNQRAYEYTGARTEELEGWGWLDYCHPEHVERVSAHFKQSIARGVIWEDTFPVRGVDGEYRWFLARAMPVSNADGRIVRWFGTKTDITERRRMEERMQESEELFRQLADSIPHAVWVVSADSATEYLNRWYREYIGLSQEAVYIPGTWKQVVHPDDVERAAAAWSGFLSTGEDPAVEYRVRRARDGQYRWQLGRGSAVKDASGRIVRWFGTITDIHDQKTAERAVREAQKLESIGLLAGGIAHDFNNLLVGIVGSASIAADMLSENHPVVDLLKRITQSGEQAAHLTRQMLAYSGKGRFILERLDISDLVRMTTPMVRPTISREIEVKLDLTPDLPPIEADRSQVQQVYTNLLINAAEAIGHRPGRINVKTGVQHSHPGDAAVALPGAELGPGPYVYLEVSDTGCGMDEKTRAKIFDPFFTTKFTGRGLGLAAVAGIMRGHKGAMLIESTPGKGSVFIAVFPAAAERGVRKADAAGPAKPGAANGVLVVDDEQVVRDIAQAALSRHGYQVFLADDATTAVEVFKEHKDRIAVVVLDAGLPGDGENVLQHFKRLKPEVRVLISSGYAEAEALAPFPPEDVAGFIEKPYTVQRFVRQVKAALDARDPAA